MSQLETSEQRVNLSLTLEQYDLLLELVNLGLNSAPEEQLAFYNELTGESIGTKEALEEIEKLLSVLDEADPEFEAD